MNDVEGRRTGARGRPANAELTPAILGAVLSLLAEDGYARLTTASVAKRAGVSTATLYRRWPSKRDLLLTAAKQVADSEVAGHDTGVTEEDLRELLAQKRRVLSGQVGATLVALAGEAAHDAELAGIIRASIIDPTRDHLSTILDRARARGEKVDVDAEAAAHLVVGAILSRIAFGAIEADGGLLSESDVTLLVRALSGVAAAGAGQQDTER